MLSAFEKKYDTWEATNAALAILKAAVHSMCEEKPAATSPLITDWEARMRELRKMIVHVHNRRIAVLSG